MLMNLKESFKSAFGVDSKESFFATARRNFLSEDSNCDMVSACGTYAVASERTDGMISLCIGDKKWTLPIESVKEEKDLEFVASVIETYEASGYSINKGINIFFKKEVPNEEEYSIKESLIYIVAQAFNRIEGFGADSTRISRMAS